MTDPSDHESLESRWQAEDAAQWALTRKVALVALTTIWGAVGAYIKANSVEWAAFGALGGFASGLLSVWLVGRRGEKSIADRRE
jgi:membrane associated rhomboid family serine protease